jgi:enoyl-CoA hydratase/carnithine racemase
MMSAQLASAYVISIRFAPLYKAAARTSQNNNVCLIKGAGHHFCPGGYVAPAGSRAASNTAVHSNLLYSHFVSGRRLSLLTGSRLHGLVVGGGVALSLNTSFRGAASMSTISFGNLSRGAVPGMLLSQTIARTGVFAHSSACYLSDCLSHACEAFNLVFITRAA